MVEDVNHPPSSEAAAGVDSQRLASVRDAVRARLFGRPAEAPPPDFPDLGDRYRVLERIGDGGSSTVWEVEHARTGRRLAAKVPRADRVLHETGAERLLLEARAIGSISHPNVVEVVDVGLTGAGTPFLVMERLVGHTIDAIVRRGPLPWERARPLLSEVGAGLAAAHAIGVIHRDLKPSNVMVVEDPAGEARCKVLDFGLARWPRAEGSERLTRTGAVFGTPGYMSPEQINGAEVSAAADIYALGCLAWELVAGRPAFRGDALGDLLYAQLFEHPDSPFGQKVPRRYRAADAWIRRCMRKRPELRFPSMRAALDALAATARNRRVGVAREHSPTEATRAAQRRTSIVLLATAAGLVATWGWVTASRSLANTARTGAPTAIRDAGIEASVATAQAGTTIHTGTTAAPAQTPAPPAPHEIAAPSTEVVASSPSGDTSVSWRPAGPLPRARGGKPRRRPDRSAATDDADDPTPAPPASPVAGAPTTTRSPPTIDRPTSVDWTNPFLREVHRTRSATDR